MTTHRNLDTSGQTSLMQQLLDRGIRAARAGELKLARDLLLQVTSQDPGNVQAWLWLAEVADDPQQSLEYMHRILANTPEAALIQDPPDWLERETVEVVAGPEVRQEALLPAGGTAGEDTGIAPEGSGDITPMVSLTEEDAEEIERFLRKISYDCEARTIILADASGRLIAERGRLEDLNTQVLSAVAAGELAATNELARLVGETARFKLLLHEGDAQRVYLSDVAGKLILIVIFDSDTPIGLVRIVLKQAVDGLTPVANKMASPENSLPHGEELDKEFFDQFDSGLESLRE